MSMAYLQFSYGIATASSVQYYNSKVRCKYCYTIQYTCFILYNTFYIWYQTVDTMIVKELSPSPSRPYCETNKRWQWWESPFINESLWFQLSLTDKLLIVNIKQTIVTGTITTLWFLLFKENYFMSREGRTVAKNGPRWLRILQLSFLGCELIGLSLWPCVVQTLQHCCHTVPWYFWTSYPPLYSLHILSFHWGLSSH